MTAAEIAAVLGNAHRSASGWRCRCLLHGSRGPTLVLRDGSRGLIVYCYAGCPPGEILAELRLRGLLGARLDGDASPPDQAIQLRRWEAEAADRQRRIAGGAVRLGELRPEVPVIVAEGLESALAASELLGWPAWAALSAGGIERLILPVEARDVVITCDSDASGVGERGARRAALRWAAEGRRVRLVIPDQVGADPNDLLRGARHAA